MSVTPMHSIGIVHREEKIREERDARGFIVEIHKCVDCGEESRITNLDSLKSQDIERLPVSKYDNRNAFTVIRKQLESEVLRGTTFTSIDEVFSIIENKYMDEIDPSEIPFRELISWSHQSTWKFKTKALLIFKQGHVCNRCDSIYVRASDLTIDHINKNRNDARLSNLQLLCISCHREKNKDGNKVTSRDVSPFSYKGKQCIHEISCVEFLELRRMSLTTEV